MYMLFSHAIMAVSLLFPPLMGKPAPIAEPVLHEVPSRAPPKDLGPPGIFDLLRKPANSTAATPTPDGRALLLSGAMTGTAADKLKQAILANPGAKTVILQSQGGLLFDGLAVAEVIRHHKLSTHVDTYCASACTLAFLGGVQRTISPMALIGFHRSTSLFSPFVKKSSDTSDDAGDRTFTKFYVEFGLDPVFIEKIMATPNESMWFPSTESLAKVGYTTGSPPSPNFSGYKSLWPTAGEVRDRAASDLAWQAFTTHNPELRKYALMGAMSEAVDAKKRQPASYSLRKGLLSKILPHAAQLPDQLIADWIDSEAQAWDETDDPVNEDCQPGFGLLISMPVSNPTSAPLIARQQKLMTQMASTAMQPAQISANDMVDAAALNNIFFSIVMARHPFALMELADKFCREPRMFFATLAQLPPDKKVRHFRSLATAIYNSPK